MEKTNLKEQMQYLLYLIEKRNCYYEHAINNGIEPCCLYEFVAFNELANDHMQNCITDRGKF